MRAEVTVPAVLHFLDSLERGRNNCIGTRNTRLAAIKAFFRYLEYRVPACLDEAKHPPTEYHGLAVRLDMSSSRIGSGLVEAKRRLKIALDPELHQMAAELKADLGPSPSERGLEERIDELLDDVLPNDEGSVERRTKEIFRQALRERLNLEGRAEGETQ